MTFDVDKIAPEGTFIMPDPNRMTGFECSRCHSQNWKLDWDANSKALILSCTDCGNFTAIRIVIPEEVWNGSE